MIIFNLPKSCSNILHFSEAKTYKFLTFKEVLMQSSTERNSVNMRAKRRNVFYKFEDKLCKL